MSDYKPVTEDYALEWGLIPSAEYLDEYNWLASKLGINHRENVFQGNVFALRLRLKNKLSEPVRQEQKVSMIPGPYGYTDDHKGEVK